MKRLIGSILLAFAIVLGVGACSTDADVVSENLSKDADQFKVERRVVAFNGITDKYLLSVEGKCSITDANKQLEVTCKVGDESYIKHFVGLSDNVSYFAEQMQATSADPYHYKVIFKPEVIIPDFERPKS